MSNPPAREGDEAERLDSEKYTSERRGSFWNEPEFRLLLAGLLSHQDWRGGGRDIISRQDHEQVRK